MLGVELVGLDASAEARLRFGAVWGVVKLVVDDDDVDEGRDDCLDWLEVLGLGSEGGEDRARLTEGTRVGGGGAVGSNMV
jgi:hypothetical protein